MLKSVATTSHVMTCRVGKRRNLSDYAGEDVGFGVLNETVCEM